MNRLLKFRGAVIACTVLGCTWTRFDDVTDRPPVERFDIPNATNAGQSLATTHAANGNVFLAASANDKVLLYDLGSGVDPNRAAVAEQPCAGDASCLQTQQLAGLGALAITDNLGCVAYGVGTPETGATGASVLLICEDLKLHSLPAPDAFATWLAGHAVSASTRVNMATSRRGNPQALVVSVPEAALAWFYDGVDSAPIELPALPDGDVTGQSLAVIADGSGYWVAASSEVPEQTIWLYRVDADRTASLAGCVEGPVQFGRLLATGSFDGDALDDLAVADEKSVVVVKGSSLTSMAGNSGSVCVPLASLEQLGHAECTQLPDLDGCAGAPYAMSLASGNLDATGPDELIIGAPNTSVRGEGSAGAAFIYAAGSDALRVVQGLYISTASAGDWLGKSVAVAQLGGIDTVLAGAPGDNTVMAFFCNSLMPAGSKSSRCH
jgi:hypothetical protein